VLLLTVIATQTYAEAAVMIPVVATEVVDKSTQEEIIIDEDAVKMVTTKTTYGYKEPNKQSTRIYEITGGTIVTADINSFGQDLVTIQHNGTICYMDAEDAKVIVGDESAFKNQIDKIYKKSKYQAEDVVEIIQAPHHYSVGGKTLYYNYQDFIWTVCVHFGIEEYFTVLLCQFYVESRYNQNSHSSTNDYGICQLNGLYHEGFVKAAGHPEWDVKTDPYANMYCGVQIMARKIKNRNGNIDIALTDYNGGDGYYPKYGIREVYVNAVRNYEKTLKQLD
jgi:hypothetical protein